MDELKEHFPEQERVFVGFGLKTENPSFFLPIVNTSQSNAREPTLFSSAKEAMDLVNNCFIGGFSNQASLFQLLYMSKKEREILVFLPG